MSLLASVKKIAGKRSVQLVTTALVFGGGGAAGGYFYAKKELKAYYEDLATVEIERAREHYAVVLKMGEFKTDPEQMVRDKYGDAVADLEYAEKDPETPRPPGYDPQEDPLVKDYVKTGEDGQPYVDYASMSTRHAEERPKSNELPEQDAPTDDIPNAMSSEEAARRRAERQAETDEVERPPERRRRNAFADTRVKVPWDWAVEMQRREDDPYTPFIITHDEFMANENEWNQEELTYYDGDNILTEEEGDEIVPPTEAEMRIGMHLVSFGIESNDPNVVYVRNVGRETEYEITRVPGKYTVLVMGAPDVDDSETMESMRHSDRRGTPRMRRHD